MKTVRMVSTFREGGFGQTDYKLVILCGVNEQNNIEDGEWMGYIKNESLLHPFILKEGKILTYGGEDNYLEMTNLGSKQIKEGTFFTITNNPRDPESWESTYEIISIHTY